MEYQVKAESGTQLLARLSARPGLGGLDERLLGSGPAPQDIIEVTGEASTGKTTLLMQWTARAILASSVGGLGAGVLLIDTDHHQPLLMLVRLLESQIRMHHANLAPAQRPSSSMVEEFIKDALKRLTIMSVYDSTQLYTAFLSLDKVLLSKPNISLLLVDSLPAFFWADRLTGGLQHMDSYLRKLLGALRNGTQGHRVTIAYTRPSYFQSATVSRNKNLATSSHYVSLSRMEDDAEDKSKNNNFCAIAKSAFGHNVQKYKINQDGIIWVKCSVR